jgi:hypothetical protein
MTMSCIGFAPWDFQDDAPSPGSMQRGRAALRRAALHAMRSAHSGSKAHLAGGIASVSHAATG